LGCHIKNEIDLVCGMNGLQDRCTLFWQGDTRERDHLEDLGIDSIMLKWILKKCDGGGMDWIGLAEERDS